MIKRLLISKISFVRATVLALLVGLGALIAIVGVNLWLVGQTRVYTDIVTAARLERSAISDLRSILNDAETGQRGYLLTGNTDYLAPYEDAEKKFAPQLDRVRSLTADDSVQTKTVDRLVPVVTDKFAELRQTIDLYHAGRADEAIARVRTNVGNELMTEARALIQSLLTRAENNIGEGVNDQQESILALRWVTIGGALVIILVMSGAVWTVLLYTKQLIQAEREVQTLNAGLEERVRERTADLGRANEEIQRFAYIVTHDLRAPLVNIMGFTSELEASLGSIQILRRSIR